MKKIIVVLPIILYFGIFSNLSAFDGRRKGFILGLGLGGGTTFTTIKDIWSEGSVSFSPKNVAGFMTDFLIGYAPNNKLLLYYVNKVTFHVSSVESFFSDLYGMTGLGVSYYFKPETRSLFFSGGLGISVESPGIHLYGYGLTAGFGYEYAKHFQIEGGVMWGNPSHSWTQIIYEGNTPKEQYKMTETTYFLSLRLTLSVLLY